MEKGNVFGKINTYWSYVLFRIKTKEEDDFRRLKTKGKILVET